MNILMKQGSSIMELSLQWADAEDGIALVNDTMQLLIDEAARQRKEILKEYMKHVETAQLTAKSQVGDTIEQLRAAHISIRVYHSSSSSLSPIPKGVRNGKNTARFTRSCRPF